MSRGWTVLFVSLAAAASALPAPRNAVAQCRLCDTPTTVAPAEISTNVINLQIEASLDFDRLILLGAGEGTAQLRPDGSTQVSGMIGAISSRAMVGSATVRGEPGRAIRIDLPRQIQLYSISGGRISVDEIVSDLPASPRLDPTGTLSFRFGGRIRISGDAEGDYRGDMPITADYL
ncbi:MAG TPA: DUF4402 domain-containing protein [Sphingomicrobium sp.]|nr:DUF4402 domain-containing protein [Sphingomicrobium sp.]